MTKLSDYVLQALATAGVRDVFLVPGGAAMHLNDSLARTEGLGFVSTFHEHAAAVAAECYGKVTGNLGVAMVTAGPGSTNAVTGVASAWVNSAPLLVLSGQVKSADLNPGRGLRQCGLQEIDIASVVAPITKYAATITDPGSARFHVEKALHLARSGRPGPVWLCVPMDVQAAQIDPASQRGFEPTDERPTSLDREVDQLIDLLNAAERPVLLVGHGVRASGCVERFLELADVLGIPVQTTWSGADLLPFDHPLYAGRPGSFAGRGANFAVQNSDFVLMLGARLDLATAGYSRVGFARAAKRVMVDVDPAEVDKMRELLALGIVASAHEVVERLLQKRGQLARRDRGPWLERVRAWLARYPVVTPDLRTRDGGATTYGLVARLSELVSGGDTFVEGGSGIHAEIFYQAVDVKRGVRIVTDASYGSMGYGLPAAIGACVGAGRRRTVLVEGDGSLQPNLQELQTVAREKLPLKIMVVNNGGYSSIRVSQNRYFGRLIGADATSGLVIPDLQRIAAAYGIRSARLSTDAELAERLPELLNADGPALCEVVVPAEEDRVPRLANVQRPDGTMMSKPMEDLFPFLDRDEFRANMLIEPLPED